MSASSEIRTTQDLLALPTSDEWDGAQTDLERGLEAWIEEIAKADRRAGVQAAMACAELALPIAAASAETSELGVGAPNEEWGDALTPIDQLAAVRAWLDSATEIPEHAADYTRQLNVWDEDLRPADDPPGDWYVYLVEATNLLLMAILHDEDTGPYDTWGASRCAARAAVCSYKAMHRANDDRAADAQQLVDAVRAAVGA